MEFQTQFLDEVRGIQSVPLPFRQGYLRACWPSHLSYNTTPPLIFHATPLRLAARQRPAFASKRSARATSSGVSTPTLS